MRLLVLVFVFVFAATASAHHDNLLWNPQGYPTDEKRGPWFTTIDLEAVDWAIQRVEDRTRKGPTALRFEVRDGDCFTAKPHAPATGWDDCTRDRERSELREKWYPELHTPVYYAYSMFIPEDYEYMYPKQIVTQWHGGASPTMYFSLDRDQFEVDIRTETSQTTHKYELGVLPKGVWLDFVVRVVWSNSDDGMVKIWVNDNLLLEHQGATMDPQGYARGQGPFAKFGIYRSHLYRWEYPERDHPTQVLYFDEYRRGYNRDDITVENNTGD